MSALSHSLAAINGRGEGQEWSKRTMEERREVYTLR